MVGHRRRRLRAKEGTHEQPENSERRPRPVTHGEVVQSPEQRASHLGAVEAVGKRPLAQGRPQQTARPTLRPRKGSPPKQAFAMRLLCHIGPAKAGGGSAEAGCRVSCAKNWPIANPTKTAFFASLPEQMRGEIAAFRAAYAHCSGVRTCFPGPVSRFLGCTISKISSYMARA